MCDDNLTAPPLTGRGLTPDGVRRPAADHLLSVATHRAPMRSAAVVAAVALLVAAADAAAGTKMPPFNSKPAAAASGIDGMAG